MLFCILYALGGLMGALVFPHTVCRHFIHQSPSIVQCRVYFTLLLTPLACLLLTLSISLLNFNSTHIQSTNKSGILVLIALNKQQQQQSHPILWGEMAKIIHTESSSSYIYFFLFKNYICCSCMVKSPRS